MVSGECTITDQWRHQVQAENILEFDPRKDYPLCIGGNRAYPPEGCGGPWRFMALRQHYSLIEILERLYEIVDDEDLEDPTEKHKRLIKKKEEFETYGRNNAALIPNYAERYRYGETLSTVDQVVSKRMVKKQQKRWRQKGAHQLLQVRTRVLYGELREEFKRWYPSFDQGDEELPMTA